MKPCLVAKKAPAKPAEHGAQCEGRQLGVGGVDAQRPAGNFVFTQGFPSAPDWQLAQTHGHEVGYQSEDQNEIEEENDPVHGGIMKSEEICKAVLAGKLQPEEGGAWNTGDAIRAAGKFIPVQQHDTNDFPPNAKVTIAR